MRRKKEIEESTHQNSRTEKEKEDKEAMQKAVNRCVSSICKTQKNSNKEKCRRDKRRKRQ